MVSKGLLQDMIHILYETHQGKDKCKVKTTQGNYYHRYIKEISSSIFQICRKYRTMNQKEPLTHHIVPAGKAF